MTASKFTLAKRVFVTLLLGIMSLVLPAQDIHYSQFKNSPFLLSPGLTGVFDGKTRVSANYRAQWYTVPVSYRTVMAAFDTKLYSNEHQTSFWGLGAVFSFDHAGDSKMGTTSLGLNGSYTHQVARAHFVTAGLQLAGAQRSFRTEQLRFDEQYNGETFDPLASNNEDFSDRSVFYGDLSIGLNWHYQKPQSRTGFNLGGGWFHLNEPNTSFWDEADIVLFQRLNGYFIGQIQLADRFDWLINGLIRNQGPYDERMLGTAGRIHLNTLPTKRLALDLGLAYRWNTAGFGNGDALVPNIEFNYRDWLFGISYDINLTDFNTATGGAGGPEFAVQYIFRPAPQIEFCPTCPVYLLP